MTIEEQLIDADWEAAQKAGILGLRNIRDAPPGPFLCANEKPHEEPVKDQKEGKNEA